MTPLKWFNAASILYGVTICFAKLAVLWLYRRVFSPQRRSAFDIVIVGLIIIIILFYTSTTFVKIFECNPRSKIYNPKVPGSCVNISMLLNTSGLFNTATDFILVLLPVKAVWNLNTKQHKKILVVLVFTFGLWYVLHTYVRFLRTDIQESAPAFSIVGFVVRVQSSNNPDKTWVQPKILLWA